MDSDQVQQKQLFLRECILEAGFDVDSFTKYLEQLRPGQSQCITTWKMDELQAVVHDFTQQQIKEQQDMLDTHIGGIRKRSQEEIEQSGHILQQMIGHRNRKVSGDYECITQDNKQNMGMPSHSFNAILKNIEEGREEQEHNRNKDDNESINSTTKSTFMANIFGMFSSQPQQKDEPLQDLQIQRADHQYPDRFYSALIPCHRQEPGLISCLTQTAKVIVGSYQVVKGGYFSSDYALFLVQCPALQAQVKRRFSDFECLRVSLNKSFPGIVLPPLPGKKKKSFDKQYLQKRALFLQKMLNDLLVIDNVRSCSALEQFLTIDNTDQFKAILKEWERTKPPCLISDLENKEGMTKIHVDENIWLHNTQHEQWLDRQQAIMQRARHISKQLESELNQATATMFKLADCLQEMSSSAKTFNSHVIQQDRQDNLQEIYLSLNNLLLLWGNHFMEQSTTTQNILTSFFKYENRALLSHKESLKVLHAQADNFYKLKDKLKYKKDRLFQQGDPSRWELPAPISDPSALLSDPTSAYQVMCHQDTQHLLHQADILAYLQYQHYSQSRRHFSRHSRSLIQQFSWLASHNLSCLDQMKVANHDCDQHLFSLAQSIPAH